MEIPRLSAKEAEILRLLTSRGELYGLEMVKSSDQLKRGTVYVTLARMAEKGYVESRQVDAPEGGLPHRLYKVTGHGARVFQAWAMVSSQLGLGWAT